MARCACGTGTCSCIVKAAPNGGVTVVGNGSVSRPYLLSIPGGNPLANIDVVDSPTLDLTISGAGTPTDKRKITGQATQSLTNLKDVQGLPTEGEIPVWRTDHWEFEAAAAAGLPVSGSWGTAPLDDMGTDSLIGQAIYLDVNSQLRAAPQAHTTSQKARAAADLAGTYPIGVSTVQMTGAQGAAGGWPLGVSGTVFTVRRPGESDADACASQWFYVTTSTNARSFYRSCSGTGAANAWSPWVQVAGLFAGQGIASSANFAPGAAQTDIPGMAVTVPVPGPDSKFAVDINLDLSVAVASSSNFIGALSVPGGGSDSTRQIVYNGGNATAAPVGTRLALSQHYLITGLGASTGTVFKATAAGTNWRVQASHSALTVTQIS